MSESLSLVLAPILGITDAIYRNAFARCFGGFDRAVAPFIPLRQGQRLKPGELQQVIIEPDRAIKTIPQVLTNHPETFTLALRQLREAGHDEVNWNLGCPYPMVAGRGKGAGLLAHPDRIDNILSKVMIKPPVKLSVKFRLGYENPDEYKAVMEVFNRYPLTEVILHPRTASQMYDGSVDLIRAIDARALCRHPFIHSGDITRTSGFRDLQTQLPGISTWMIGRGALACPFLPSLLKGIPLPSPDVRRQRLRDFHHQLIEGYSQRLSGPRHLMDKMMEQWEYLSLAFAHPHQLLTRIHRSDSDSYDTTIEWVFDQPLAEISET